MKNIVSITFKDGIKVNVEDANKYTNKELVKIIEEKLLEELKRNIPSFTYSLLNEDDLTFEDIYVGMIVDIGKQGYGIVTKINKKSINVNGKNGIALQGHPLAFKRADEKIKAEDVIWKRFDYNMHKSDSWYEGDTGYFSFKSGIKPVILVSKGNNKFRAHVIGMGVESGADVTAMQLQTSLYDTFEEAIERKRKEITIKGELTQEDPPKGKLDK